MVCEVYPLLKLGLFHSVFRICIYYLPLTLGTPPRAILTIACY